ncbi:Piso0_000815 [Millerozyma farinosa CBS 7064]|uniref:Hsp90 chaperone protein kinase-targeting subunit n=1 Tax=Pichia sorbitophila (strain ATCC MYA-4447 / BCRC 22081 / CBS 7064 / NBRC 10061 / NRRL Y-12695) TaxID=559304 RepID=G8YRL1_PICSO|nr:Piso0_000815 [Millerozyma farinosa CBS 7064]
MPIDYSKWDNLELSDDSDIEVHPNVDKRSFIRWKQRDIHEKRQQRNIEIKSILVQLRMYARLNERMDYLLGVIPKQSLCDEALVMETLNREFDPEEKFDYEKLKEEKGNELRKGLKDLVFEAEETENTPPYNEMIEDLFIQIKEDHPEAASDPDKLLGYIKEHRVKIDDVLSKQSVKLDTLLAEKSQLISSEDYHTGFDRSFMNRDEEEKEKEKEKEKESVAKAPEPSRTKETKIETLNSGEKESTSSSQEIPDLQLLSATEEFGTIPEANLDQSASFLLKHTNIVNENQKDALIMTAFDHQLQDDSATARQVIHQSLLLQYIAQLAGPHPNKDRIINAVKLFCTKLNDPNVPAKAGFLQDVENTFNHIKKRCEIIKEEQTQNNDDEALIQLKALDDNTELSVNLPKEGTKEYEIFSTKLSPEMQEAVKKGSLDEVNEVFAKLKVEEAEEILEIFNECGVIGINGYLEDEDEFKELQKQYQEAEEAEENVNPDSLDVVD